MSQQVFPRPKCRVPTFVEMSTTSNLVDEVPPKVESIDVVYHEGKIYVAHIRDSTKSRFRIVDSIAVASVGSMLFSMRFSHGHSNWTELYS